MEQIEELQARVLAAMDRIAAGVSTLEASQEAAAAATPNAELEQALDEERTANAQLEERLRVLRARLDELETEAENAASGGGDAETVAALEAEVQLLRNEVGNTAERDALRLEVDRLKAALEGALNEAATAKEHCEMVEAEAAQLKTELEAAIEAAAPDDTPVISEVDFVALEAENKRLKGELETATAAVSSVEAQLSEAQEIASKAQDETAQAQAAQAEALAAKEQAEAAAEAAKQEITAAPAPVPAEDDETLIKLDQELTTLRAANDQLVQSNAALREANAEGVGDPALINAALQAEVDGLRAANATDRAEMSAVIARLEPLLANSQSMPQGESE